MPLACVRGVSPSLLSLEVAYTWRRNSCTDAQRHLQLIPYQIQSPPALLLVLVQGTTITMGSMKEGISKTIYPFPAFCSKYGIKLDILKVGLEGRTRGIQACGAADCPVSQSPCARCRAVERCMCRRNL